MPMNFRDQHVCFYICFTWTRSKIDFSKYVTWVFSMEKPTRVLSALHNDHIHCLSLKYDDSRTGFVTIAELATGSYLLVFKINTNIIEQTVNTAVCESVTCTSCTHLAA